MQLVETGYEVGLNSIFPTIIDSAIKEASRLAISTKLLLLL